MSRAPGTQVTTITAPPSRGAPTDTGVVFVTGIAQRGAVGVPIVLTGMNDYATYLGARISNGAVYDFLDVAFREGLSKAVFSRVIGPAAVAANHTFVDRAGSPLSTVKATVKWPGPDGNNVTVAISNGGGSNTFVATVKYSGTVVDTSPDLANPAAAVAWQSAWIAFTDLASVTAAPNNNPAVVADTAMASGADDAADITETQWTAALTAFVPTLGPGQVAAPGRTTDAAHVALLAHAAANNRFAILDLADTPTVATQTTAATNAISGVDGSYGAAFAPWIVVPPLPGTTSTRSAPPSALIAGLCATVDAIDDPDTAPMGPLNGSSLYALDVTQHYSDVDRGTLNSANIDVLINPLGIVMNYGLRTLDSSGSWQQLTNSRLRMAIAAKAGAIGDNYVGQKIDDEVNGMFADDLKGMLAAYQASTAIFAYAVDNGPTIQTDVLTAAGTRVAVISVQMNESAEFTNIEVIKYPLTATIPTGV